MKWCEEESRGGKIWKVRERGIIGRVSRGSRGSRESKVRVNIESKGMGSREIDDVEKYEKR